MRPMRPGWGPGFGPECGGRMHHMHGMHGPGPRFFERGGIKFAILEMLREKPRHGYDIIREMEERSGGFYSPSPGAVYPTLQALEDQDLVTAATEEGKTIYSITAAGIAYLDEHRERARSHRERWEAHWGPGPQGEGWAAIGDLRDSLGDIKRAVRRCAGDPEKLKEIEAVVDEAAQKIRAILNR
jgi:DNA-binding PadR family transcriptional regulator